MSIHTPVFVQYSRKVQYRMLVIADSLQDAMDIVKDDYPDCEIHGACYYDSAVQDIETSASSGQG
jgi:hypothetical protein